LPSLAVGESQITLICKRGLVISFPDDGQNATDDGQNATEDGQNANLCPFKKMKICHSDKIPPPPKKYLT
jgi:hypothetical protein